MTASFLDCVVIGAGVVGLAVARALQVEGREVVLLEKADSFGTETSSRNSEVIHAGIYYPQGSLKASTCVRGKRLLYEYCGQRDIPHRRLGKIIVAVNETEIATLEKYRAAAYANGVDDLVWLEPEQVAKLEPDVRCVRALLSPSTGIIDSHAYMLALLGDFEGGGGVFVPRTLVERGWRESGGVALEITDAERSRVTARTVVNCAGLHAPQLASRIEGIASGSIPHPHYAIGHYYVLTSKSPFKRLVYPIASAGGLGVHVTIDMAGAARFGPDVRWRDGIDYTFDDSRRAAFLEAIRAYYPAMRADWLSPGHTGIRPKIAGPEQPVQDFVIQDAADHQVDGLINLFGIESPGLTASLGIAEMVAAMARRH
jgi:L-2-hydroxyglutarate oxidase LhgO